MNYKILYRRYKNKLKRQKQDSKRMKNELHDNKREIAQLRKELAVFQDGYVIEWCDNCHSQITMLWDPGTEGLLAYCPVCGSEMMLCDSCHWKCDYDYGKDSCIGKRAGRKKGRRYYEDS